ncbi:hypothetical protein G6F40_017323 [Rhizopus arrhizus]|nr:hypothetical protein G6F40_017323 [Rhizopus arrhizus]
MAWISWNSAIGWPNCLRSIAYLTASDNKRSAIPTHSAEICRRPLSSTRIDVRKPLPSSPPSKALAGTRQLSKWTDDTGDPAWPILS